MSERHAKVVQLGEAYAVILPIDWCRGKGIEKGRKVRMVYDGVVTILAEEEDSSDY